MSKRLVISAVIACVATMFLAAGLYAEDKACAEDVIVMKNEKAFEEHKLPVVNFSHEKHAAAEPDGYGIGCGECHHDEEGNPLTDLKKGDAVQTCFECHSGTGPGTPKDFMGPPPTAEQLNSYYTAIHVNCVVCHKEGKKGPITCKDCHIKEGNGE